MAREVVRLVQDARKTAGLEVSDRIVLGIAGSEEVAEALDAHADYVAGETLATELRASSLADATSTQSSEIDGATVTLTLRRA